MSHGKQTAPHAWLSDANEKFSPNCAAQREKRPKDYAPNFQETLHFIERHSFVRVKAVSLASDTNLRPIPLNGSDTVRRLAKNPGSRSRMFAL